MSLERARSTAGHLRAERGDLVTALATGAVAPEVLGADARAAEVKVVVLAEAVPGVGKVAARRAMAGLGIPPGARWGELAPAQAQRLVEALRAAGAPPAAGP